VCAVSYLNTVPLVWGMLHGPQRGVFDLTFAVPSACAAEVRDGESDIGIVPTATLLEQNLKIFRGTGIACHGPVRTILLISKKTFREIGFLAVDSGSRTSVMLARVLLAQVWRAQPALIAMPPGLDPMLEVADAALIIGDPALLLDPDALRSQGLHVADLGHEWTRFSGLPMVFAVWAGHRAVYTPANEAAFIGSCQYGLEHLDDIVAAEHARRGITPELARHYLTENLVLELGETEYRGMTAFLESAAALPPAQYLELAAATTEKNSL
jgi:predicted solute-binding protein